MSESYSLHFIAPALRCDLADTSLINETAVVYEDLGLGQAGDQYHHVAWAPNHFDRFDLDSIDVTGAARFMDLVSIDAAHTYIIPNKLAASPVDIGGDHMRILTALLDMMIFWTVSFITPPTR